MSLQLNHSKLELSQLLAAVVRHKAYDVAYSLWD